MKKKRKVSSVCNSKYSLEQIANTLLPCIKNRLDGIVTIVVVNHHLPFMKRLRSISFLLLILSVSSIHAETAPWHFGGGPLTRSIQNEANAAINAASAWLADRQDANGSWATNDVRLTSLCAIALLSAENPFISARPPSHLNCRRAIQWLQSPAATNALSTLKDDKQLSARAWREMALCAFTRGKTPKDDVLLRPLPVTNAPLPRALFLEWPVTEARNFRGIKTERPDSTNGCAIIRFISDTQRQRVSSEKREILSDDLSQAWMDAETNTNWTKNAEAAWWLARMINRSLGGELSLKAKEGNRIQRLTWRQEMAEHWITTQRIDTTGKGYWGNESLETTVFGILLLGEL